MRTPGSSKSQNILIWILLILLLGSLALNFATFFAARKYYSSAYAAILDPIGLSYFLEETDVPPNDGKIVVFYGDSRAVQWPAPRLNGHYFLNRGIGNQTSAQVLLRFEEHVSPLNPDIVILEVCINDLKTIPLFPEKKARIIGGCKSNIDTIIQKSLDTSAVVIVTTVFPTSGNVPIARKPVWSDEVYKAIDEVNDFIRNYSMDNVLLFDAAKILSNSEGNVRPEYVFDLLHLNVTGYDALNIELVKLLESVQ